MAVQLNPYNNVALAASTPTQLAASSGWWNLTLIATAAGTYIKQNNTVAAADPASFPLPANIPVNLVIWGPSGIWALATAAGNLGALLTPQRA